MTTLTHCCVLMAAAADCHRRHAWSSSCPISWVCPERWYVVLHCQVIFETKFGHFLYIRCDDFMLVKNVLMCVF